MGVLENEYHFLLVCPVFLDLRSKYIARKYYLNATINKLYILLSCKNETVTMQQSYYYVIVIMH